MLRRALLIAPIPVLTVPIAAQVQAGWKVRIDGSQSASAHGANRAPSGVRCLKSFYAT